METLHQPTVPQYNYWTSHLEFLAMEERVSSCSLLHAMALPTAVAHVPAAGWGVAVQL